MANSLRDAIAVTLTACTAEPNSPSEERLRLLARRAATFDRVRTSPAAKRT